MASASSESSQGVVDISQFPSMLLQRVDVVTGGASASWGSDACQASSTYPRQEVRRFKMT